jgi:2-amino-4-hydroxy-6-hydroxymethyldihydropteridine diphosphokinase
MRCFLALGSNMGDRQAHLRAALEGLSRLGIRTVRSASLYATEPKGFLDQPWFLNTVIEVVTALEPRDLMHACLQVEESRQRRRDLPDRPRTLDIDIILFGDRIVESKEVTIPHPRYRERRFVLEPLAEIASDVVDPVSRLSVGELLEQVRDESEVRHYSAPLV